MGGDEKCGDPPSTAEGGISRRACLHFLSNYRLACAWSQFATKYTYSIPIFILEFYCKSYDLYLE